MSTIAVYSKDPCKTCGDGRSIDHVATGANARKWRDAAQVSQRNIGRNGMGLSQQYYAQLELGTRHWTPELIGKFEKQILPLLKKAGINPKEVTTAVAQCGRPGRPVQHQA